MTLKSTVYNKGVPGENSAVTLGKLESMLEECSPETVVISTGANDVVNPVMFIPAEETRKNVREIVRIITANGSECLILAPVPINFDEFAIKYPALKPKVEAGLYREYCARHDIVLSAAKSAGAMTVDPFPAFAAIRRAADSAESLTRNKANCGANDGVHPTPQGHALIAAMLAVRIQAGRLPTGRVLCAGDSITHGYPLAGMGTVDGDNYPSMLSRILNFEM